MKKKMLSMAAAITMAVVILTGCSAGFKRDSVIEAAKEYGMDDTRAFYQAAQITNVDTKAFYISDSKQADDIRRLLMHAGFDTAYDLKETILLSDVKAVRNEDDMSDARTRILYMTAADAKTAKEIYDINAEWVEAHDGTSGKQKGVEYAINYVSFTTSDDREAESFYGIYIKGDTVIWIEAFTNNGPIDECTEFFCNKLGLVSPLTLRK